MLDADFEIVSLEREGSASNARSIAPRLIAISVRGQPDSDAIGPSEREAGANPLEIVRSARAKWPLVDCVAWVPTASGAVVRALLKGGAKDVVIEDGIAALRRSLREILAEQSILPRVEALASSRVRRSKFEGMLSRSDAMWDLFETTHRIAPTDANVLICGETGTGKELFARAVHRRSGRKGRFVALNCSALPEHLVESELFGHEKGAFTGATRSRDGLFRSAEGGTVFLDEIGDMSDQAQQSLLRVLEARRVRPVGGTAEVDIDVRVVAATNVPLENAVADGSFREDLFYRLDVIRLDVPPLRERPEDVIYLFGFFLKTLSKHYGVEPPAYSDGFLDALSRHPWPGNVRELENFSERVVLRKARGTIQRRDFERWVRAPRVSNSDGAESSATRAASSGARDARVEDASTEADLDRPLAETVEAEVERIERDYLEAALASTRGRMQEAADLAGISRRTLLRKLRQYEIEKSNFRD